MDGSTVNNLIEPKMWPLCMAGSMDGLDPPNKPGLTHTESYSPLHTKPAVLFLYIIPTYLSSHFTLPYKSSCVFWLSKTLSKIFAKISSATIATNTTTILPCQHSSRANLLGMSTLRPYSMVKLPPESSAPLSVR